MRLAAFVGVRSSKEGGEALTEPMQTRRARPSPARANHGATGIRAFHDLRCASTASGFRASDSLERLMLRSRLPKTRRTSRSTAGHHLDSAQDDPRRQSAQVSRLLHPLHVYGLVAKIPRSWRWRVTAFDHRVVGASVQLRQRRFPRPTPRPREVSERLRRKTQRTLDAKIYALTEEGREQRLLD
jgi:hypothetical protein